MGPKSLVMPIAADLATGMAFAVAWSLRWQGCAPPSVFCQLPETGCAAVCIDPGTQWTVTFPFGLLLGLPPAVMAFVQAWSSRASAAFPAPISRTLNLVSALAVAITAAGLCLVFLFTAAFTGNPLPWSVVAFGAALFILPATVRQFGQGPSSR